MRRKCVQLPVADWMCLRQTPPGQMHRRRPYNSGSCIPRAYAARGRNGLAVQRRFGFRFRNSLESPWLDEHETPAIEQGAVAGCRHDFVRPDLDGLDHGRFHDGGSGGGSTQHRKHALTGAQTLELCRLRRSAVVRWLAVKACDAEQDVSFQQVRARGDGRG